MKQKFYTAAVDVGYGSVKVIGGYSGSHDVTETLLPSGAIVARLAPKVQGVADLKGGEEVLVENDEGVLESWVAGLEPKELKRPRELAENFPLTPTYLALFRAALQRLNQDTIDLLVTGLPTNQFFSEKNGIEMRRAIVSRLQGEHPRVDGSKILVRKVAVIAQPLGAFMSVASMDKHADLITENISCLAVDPGFGTVDWVAMSGRAVVETSSGTSLVATSKILEDAAAAMSKEHGVLITRDDLDLAMRRGVREQRINYETRAAIAPYIEQAARENALSAVTAMRSSLRDHGRIDLIIVTGGGASLYVDAIREAWPKSSVIMVDNPAFGNARGYRAVAEAARSQQIERDRQNSQSVAA